MIGTGDAERLLTDDEIRAIVLEAVDTGEFDGKRVVALIPDLTRTCPVDLFSPLLAEFDKLLPATPPWKRE